MAVAACLLSFLTVDPAQFGCLQSRSGLPKAAKGTGRSPKDCAVGREKFPLFSRYVSVGGLNSLVHAAIFAFALQVLELGQSLGNLLAFFVALSFSFMVNGRYTFRARLSLRRYLLFLTGMGSLSAGLGYLADRGNWPPLITFVGFSLTSLILGFIFTRWIFREERAWKLR